MSEVRLEHRDGIAIITIDRPEARNAISPEVALQLEAAVDQIEGDGRTRVAVLTGSPPVFCAGADLKAIHAGRGSELSTGRGGFGGFVRRERRIPFIAAVDGAALAGGFELVLACDLVVASEAARFGLPEVTRGLVAAAGGLFRIGRALPATLGMELALTGDPIDASTAHAAGLVNRITPAGQALTGALELADRIAANAPLAVQASRSIVADCTLADDDAGWERSAIAAAEMDASADLDEGLRAFIEKRPPVWQGR